MFIRDTKRDEIEVKGECVRIYFITKSLILAQDERWRRGLGMQVERETPSLLGGVEWRTGE